MRWFRNTLAAVTILALMQPLCAQTPEADEYEVKAALLLNVVKLVDWPPAKAADSTSAFLICVMNSADMESALNRALTKNGARTPGGRPIATLKATPASVPSQCEVIFVGGTDRRRTQSVLQTVARLPILSIGESESFAGQGGMIALLATGDHIQVEVNLPATQTAGLTVSSRLLRIATLRTGGNP